MELSFAEKLILIMLSEIHQSLKVKGEIDPAFVQKAIFNEAFWSLTWKYPGLVGSGQSTRPHHVQEVLDILEMWEGLEESYKRLPPEGKDKVRAEANRFGTSVRFPGFDGNHETEYLGAAKTLIDDLDGFTTFSGRDLNSHMPLLATYQHMVEVYRALSRTPSSGLLSADQLIQVLNA